ncbi:hypothetical protein BC831DRAFT_450236 [Entophlyctis helioformis]|nr:hypothetical protein BC831DRAFT_450236 [Entophlyctis helioformis]
MPLLEDTSAKLGLGLTISTTVLFGVAAVVYSFYGIDQSKVDTEYFLTARNSQPIHRLAWSFFAAAMGAWAMYGPAQFVADPAFGAGLVGLISYSFFAGFPLIMVAYMGGYIRKNVPNATSVTSFAYWRFGRAGELFVALLVLLNLSIALTAEYTSIGNLFSDFFGVPRYVPILVVGIVTMVYTATGGLYVSIITDQWQALFSLVIVAVSAVYLGVSFKDVTLPPLPAYLGPTETGYYSLLTLGISLISATFFSDAIWQRVWASSSERSLRIGAVIGSALVMLVVAFLGFGGMLAYWSGRAPSYEAGGNSALGFFYAFNDANGNTPPVIIIIMILFAAAMNESAVDSLQNAVTDTFVSMGSSFGLTIPTYAARLTVLIVNIPIFVVGLQGYDIIRLFLIGNMVTTCCFLPFAAGLIPALNGIVSGTSAILACIFSFFSVAVLGVITTGDFATGLEAYFYSFVYDWRAFVTGSVSSVVGLILFSCIELAVRSVLGWGPPTPPIMAADRERLAQSKPAAAAAAPSSATLVSNA